MDNKKEYEITYAEMTAFENEHFEGFRINWGAKGVGFGQLDFYYKLAGEEKDEHGEPINRKLMCDDEYMGKAFAKAVLMKMIDDTEFESGGE